MKSAIVPVAIGVGFLLLALSFLWPALFSARASWSNEKAARRSEIQDRLHYLGFLLSAPQGRAPVNTHAPADLQRNLGMRDLVKVKAEYDELMAENNQLNDEFSSAYNRPRIIASILKWTGMALAGIGVIGWYATRQ